MTSSVTKQAALAAIISVLMSGPCGGQDPRSPATASECDAAIVSVERLVSRPHAPDASEQQQLWTATRCGAPGGAALAKLIPLARTSTDIPSFIKAEEVATNLADSSIARASLQLASDAGASAAARIFAFRVLMRLNSPSTSVDAAQSYATSGTNCKMHTIAALEALPGAPLPSDLAQRAGALAKATAVSSAPANVRAIASCAYREFGAFANLDVDPTKISLSYVCGNDFRVQNGNTVRAPLTYRVVSKADDGDINVPANGTLTFRTDSTGTVNLYLNLPVVPNDPQPISTAANAATKCGN
jgi:hypothetical protein